MSILQDAMDAAIRLMPAAAPDPLIDADRIIGKPVSRLDGKLKVMGRARFAAEIPFANLAYAALVTSTIARGRILSIDTQAAEASHQA